MKILYVEDNESFIEIVKIALVTQLNHDVKYAVNGVEAEMVLATEKENGWVPDLVITDIGMPKMDGNRLVADLQKTYKDIPVAVVTADPDSAIFRSPPIIGVYNKMNLGSLKDMFREMEWKIRKA